MSLSRSLLVVVLGTLVVAHSAAAATAPAAQACPEADATVSAATAAPLRGVVLCLLNRERAARGLAALRANAPLSGAAGSYARLMVAGRFFDHVSPSGSTLRSRAARAGYLRDDYLLGEDIATAAGTEATPAAIVDAWMNSPPHRRNILEPRFRDAGTGVAPGLATGWAPDGATYVVDFGRRG
jgi:uncharacterized protein YkwD